jgi:hypothetical protein
MRRLWAIGLLVLWAGALAQIEPKADEWLERSFKAYSALQSLQSKTTVTVLLITPKNPQGETVQKLLYAYTVRPPAQINLLVKDTAAQGEGTRYLCDGTTLKSGERTVPVQGSGAALLEGLVSLDVFTPYDMVFLLGGKSSQEKIKKEIKNLRVAAEDEKQVTLSGRVRNERDREDEWEFVIDKQSQLMRRIKIATRAKLEGQDAQFVLTMEFEPTPNPPVSEKTFSGEESGGR